MMPNVHQASFLNNVDLNTSYRKGLDMVVPSQGVCAKEHDQYLATLNPNPPHESLCIIFTLEIKVFVEQTLYFWIK